MSLQEKLAAVFERRRQSYITTFSGPVPERVLADLAKFCRANEPTFHPDARVHAVLEGRREVWLRIQKYLRLKPADIDALTRLAKEDGGDR